MPRDREQVIIAVVGMPGSGKSLACDYFKSQGYPVLRFGDTTDLGLKSQGLPLTPDNERHYRESLRKELGMAAYALKIEPRLKKTFRSGSSFRSGAECIILDGLYSWEEYIYLKPKFPQLKLLAIYAPPALRRQRLAKRFIRPLSAAKTKQRDIAEIENLHKAGPIAIADYLIVNAGSITAFHQELAKALEFFYE
ncbi:MAG: AAA family ATPase [Patescibacteria group bacterium]|nr:AAA family ATPase [Patescibacteria group bacterium]